MSDPPFSGWPQTAIEFFEGLELDNCKTFWLDHKDVYEQDVKPDAGTPGRADG